MSFEQLPSELQIEVFRYLDNVDLKAARATSRKSRDNASPILFRSVIACARYLALGAFQKVSVHPVLSKYVKEIVFDGSLYEAVYAGSQDAYCAKNDAISDLRTSSFWGKRTRWKRYEELYKDQEDMKASGVLLQTMSRALGWTTNLSSIVYSPHPHLVPVEKKEVRDLLPRGVTQGSYDYSRHPFRYLVGAIFMSQYPGVRELRIEPYCEQAPGTEFTHAMFDFPEIDNFEAARYLFSGLHKCELDMAPAWTPLALQDKSIATMRALLMSATELRHLALHLIGWCFEGESTSDGSLKDGTSIFKVLGLRNTWSKLKSISLEGLHGTAKDFIELVNRHRYTLDSLSIQTCGLTSGRWSEIVDEVVCNTRILPFCIDTVNDPWDQEELEIAEVYMTGRKYDGHVTVHADGERHFIETNSQGYSIHDWQRRATITSQ